jgi:hypothetical protein
MKPSLSEFKKRLASEKLAGTRARLTEPLCLSIIEQGSPLPRYVVTRRDGSRFVWDPWRRDDAITDLDDDAP